MALRRVVQVGEEVLTKKAKDVTAFDDKLWQLLDDMYETMKSSNGVGLAAPQVGILRRVVTIDVGEGLIELVNPIITYEKGKQRQVEGCLSAPHKWGYVVRPMKVKVTAKNRYGKEIKIEGEELLAVALCHEIDHLNGIMFLEKADEMVEEKERE